MAAVTTGWLGRAAVAALMVLWIGSAATVLAQAQRPLDSEVQAAYLLNFIRFVRWPGDGRSERPADPWAICVLGRDPLGSVLDATIGGESIDGRTVVARRIARPEDAAGCHVLFVEAAEQASLANLLQRLRRAPLLTVGDAPRFLENGGMIRFVTVDSRIRFEINLAAVERADLTLSSDLLRVALAVKRVGE
jgi:hypothetical protein